MLAPPTTATAKQSKSVLRGARESVRRVAVTNPRQKIPGVRRLEPGQSLREYWNRRPTTTTIERRRGNPTRRRSGVLPEGVYRDQLVHCAVCGAHSAGEPRGHVPRSRWSEVLRLYHSGVRRVFPFPRVAGDCGVRRHCG